MPKSKVRKKPVKKRGRAAGSETEAMTIPLWEYPDAAKAMSQEIGDTEETCFQILMALPTRHWTSDGTKITYLIPHQQAEESGLSLEEWFDSYQTLYEIGSIAWDNENKAHYFTGTKETI